MSLTLHGNTTLSYTPYLSNSVPFRLHQESNSVRFQRTTMRPTTVPLLQVTPRKDHVKQRVKLTFHWKGATLTVPLPVLTN